MDAHHFRPKEDLTDTVLCVSVVAVLVLVAGLMSGEEVQNSQFLVPTPSNDHRVKLYFALTQVLLLACYLFREQI